MKLCKIICAAILLLLAAGGCSAAEKQPVTTSDSDMTEGTAVTEPVTVYSELLDCRHYDEMTFFLSDGRSKIYEADGEILCGVVPHHLTAGYFISGFLRTVAENRTDIETVVIIAPMHYDDIDTLCTTESGWATPFGAMETDTDITDIFKSKLGASVNDEMLQYDHSASAHIPFIKYYLPEAKTACLLVSPDEKNDIPEKLTETLKEISELKSCLFLFSIDFSHYLSPEEADMMDKITLDAVIAGNTEAIEAMTDNNVDSPYCLSTYVRLSEALGGKIAAADNSNTWKILEKPYNRETFNEGVTSYFLYLTTE